MSDPNVDNAVVLMDIEVIRNMTMFPICRLSSNKMGGIKDEVVTVGR
jgi:hypothetical protein